MVLGTVEQTLNAMLDAEADENTQAHKYERTENRADTRAGHYQRNFVTKAGVVKLQVPKLRKMPFETAIIGKFCIPLCLCFRGIQQRFGRCQCTFPHYACSCLFLFSLR